MAPILFLVPCSCFSLHFNCCTSFPTFASGSLCFFSLFFLKLLQVGCHGSLKKKNQLKYYVLFFLGVIVFTIPLLLLQASTSQGFSLLSFYNLITFSFSSLHINRCSFSLLSFFNLNWFYFFLCFYLLSPFVSNCCILILMLLFIELLVLMIFLLSSSPPCCCRCFYLTCV